MDNPTVLVTAYAVNPYKGSEDGMGWNMILQIARFQKVIAITRENNRPEIERYLAENRVVEASNIRFAYFDTPYYTRFWKRGGKGALLYFYIWQYAVSRWIQKQDWQYDIVHNLNFHNDWTPSFLWRLKKPFVWGPIGHHPKIPTAFLKQYGIGQRIREGIRWAAKQLFWNFDPFLKKTKQNAEHIFAMNTEVAQVLHLPENKVTILPSVASEEISKRNNFSKDSFNVLSIGRFVALKGFDVTIRAFATFYHTLSEEARKDVSLTLVGKGPAEAMLRDLAERLMVSEAINFIPWIERSKLTLIYEGADVFLFPSHEGAGMVVAEAMSYGLPVVCFDNCGPGEFINRSCGLAIPYQDYPTNIEFFKQDLLRLYEDRDLLQRLSSGARRQHANRLTWDVKGNIFRAVYQSIISKHNRPIQDENDKEHHIYTSAK